MRHPVNLKNDPTLLGVLCSWNEHLQSKIHFSNVDESTYKVYGKLVIASVQYSSYKYITYNYVHCVLVDLTEKRREHFEES